MLIQSCWPGRSRLGFLSLILTTLVGCSGPPEEPPATESGAPSSATSAVTQPVTGIEPGVPLGSPKPGSGTVLAGKDLGMVVSGKGAGEPGRSLDVLEQQIFSFLPQLQEVYERERAQDPNLMGSLDVILTIEPGGGISDLRFPLRRVASEKLTNAVFDLMRTWTFPPAADLVQLRLTLLFVPPDMDQASILVWEKRLGSRAVMDRSEAPSTPVTVAAASTPGTKASPAVSPPPASSSAKSTMPARVPFSGWYRLTNPAPLHAAPQASSGVVAQLRKGTRVRVVAVVGGQWLEVHSVNNKPPGFLWREDAEPERPERVGGR
jgi:hypothetical protein